MIEVTDEMIVAFEDAAADVGIAGGDTRAGLAAVFAIVERDLTDQAKREWDALEYCPSIDPDHPGWRCERQAGHDGPHRAMGWQLEWS